MKRYLLSWLSPCGRIGVGRYWKRQILLAILTAVCTSPNLAMALQLFDRDSLWQGLCYLPALPGQGNPLLLSMMFAANDQAYVLLNIHSSGDPTCSWEPGTAILYASLLLLALLAGWSSFALLLRRLRDTRPGLWAFPFCLPMLWVPLAPLLVGLSLILSVILPSLPGRKGNTRRHACPPDAPEASEGEEPCTRFHLLRQGIQRPDTPTLAFSNGLHATRHAGHRGDIILSHGEREYLRARNLTTWKDRFLSKERFSLHAEGIEGSLTLHAHKKLELRVQQPDGTPLALTLPLLEDWRTRLWCWQLPEFHCSLAVERSCPPEGGSIHHEGELSPMAALLAYVCWECHHREDALDYPDA